jgi:ABC-type metal ion transport system substrate-binding protein
VKRLIFAALLCAGQPAVAQAVRNYAPESKSLVKVLVVYLLGYEEPAAPMRVYADKPIDNLGKGVDIAVNNQSSNKKRVELRP